MNDSNNVTSNYNDRASSEEINQTSTTNIEQVENGSNMNQLEEDYGNSTAEEDAHPERNPDVGQTGEANPSIFRKNIMDDDQGVLDSVGDAIVDPLTNK